MSNQTTPRGGLGPAALALRSARWLARTTLPTPMSWAAWRFDTTKRARHARVTAALETVRTPAEPGLVSIVLPTHDGAAHLAESIDSVLAQTYGTFELIVVDDGSTDATPAILTGYERRDPRVCVIRQPPQRLPRALSAGFRAARGEFLTWTSDDNRMKPDFLERLVASLRRHPRWDMAYANEDLIGEDGRALRGSRWFWNYQTPAGSEHIALPTDPSELNTVANNHVGAAFLYRDRVDWLLGDYSALRFGIEDYDYWMRVNLFLSLRHADFPEPIYDYRFHSRSLTSRDEELGITRSRAALMAFDDFRRDFALVPLALELTAGNTPAARAVVDAIARWADAAGHVRLDRLHVRHDERPRLWFPAVDVTVTTDATATPPIPLTRALRVLVATGDSPLPEAMDPAWDLCVTTRALARPPRLAGARRGWMAIPDLRALVAAIDVRVRSEQLAAIETELGEAAPPAYDLSVVVCTYRRPALLEDCLVSLARQTLPPAHFEVIVVNNDPSDVATGTRVAGLRDAHFPGRPERLRLVQCPFPGLSFARNAGISEARGTVVCFIDDDARARADWLAELWRVYCAHPDAGVVGGSVRLQPPEPRPRCVLPGWERFWSQYVPDEPEVHEVTETSRFPYGANWSARREVLLAIGGFRSGYGRRGADFGGGEEIVAACLARQIGGRVLVAPAAEVLHVPEAARFTFRHVWRTALRSVRNWHDQQLDLYLPMTLKPHRIPRWTAREAMAVLRRGGSLPARLEHAMLVVGNAKLFLPFLGTWLSRHRRTLARSF